MNNAGDSTLRWPRSLWRSSQSSGVETWPVPGSMLVVDSHLGVGGKSRGSKMKRLKRSRDHKLNPEGLRKTCTVQEADRQLGGSSKRLCGLWEAGWCRPKCGAAGVPRCCLRVGWQCVWEAVANFGRQALGPHCTHYTTEPRTQRSLLDWALCRIAIKDSDMPPNKGTLIFMKFLHCFRK